jgi:hypothetical protein
VIRRALYRAVASLIVGVATVLVALVHLESEDDLNFNWEDE